MPSSKTLTKDRPLHSAESVSRSTYSFLVSARLTLDGSAVTWRTYGAMLA